MAQVFISFIHEEEAVAISVKDFITQVLGETVNPFLSSDTSTVYAGERWMDRTVDELKGAKVVISLLSPESVKRPWVNFEAGAAWIKDAALIPACFWGPTKDTLPKPYSSLQAVNLSDSEDQYYLVKSIAHYLQLPAPPWQWGPGTKEQREEIGRPYADLKYYLDVLRE